MVTLRELSHPTLVHAPIHPFLHLLRLWPSTLGQPHLWGLGHCAALLGTVRAHLAAPTEQIQDPAVHQQARNRKMQTKV